MKYHNELSTFQNIKLLFKNTTKIINIGDVGVYQDMITISTYNDGTNKTECKFSVKVKATGVFENLVEIEVIELSNISSCDEHLGEIIKASIPKYVHPRYVKWAIK